ncbi:HSF-type DNA-binding-domain-containing protein [Chlamydoabsidia padenii]|nr:HSF-type DNA-binding-domain-containing protein [Chlamydoabsidia padenii]
MKEPVTSSTKRLSPFIKKMWTIMSDNTLESIIHWTEQGTVVCIVDSISFCKTVLPQYFKHNNWHSFVRQLNLYGFRKVYHFNISIDYVAGRQESIRQFKHQHFYKTGEHDLVLIHRKIAPAPSLTPSSDEWHQHVEALLSEFEKHMDEMERQQEEIRLENQYLHEQHRQQEKVKIE